MVAAPLLHVVFEVACRYGPERRTPGHAITVGEVHDQIRRLGGVRATIDLGAREDAANGERAMRRVAEAREVPGDRARQRVRLTRLDDAPSLAALEVQVDATQSERVSARALPVDASQEVGAVIGRFCAVTEREQALVMQPGIDVDAAAEARYTVIAEHGYQRLVVCVAEGLSHDPVTVHVVVLDDACQLRGEAGLALALAEAPEHVLDAIGRIEAAKKEACTQALELVSHHRRALAHYLVALLPAGA